MDLSYFMRERTALIRLFYDKGRLPFEQMKQDIEDEVDPWEPPSFNSEYDSDEPAFLEEFMRAEQTRELVGLLAVSLLSDTLKLYFEELERDIGIEFENAKARKTHFKEGFVEAYRQILEHVMGEAYATCTIRFDLIEQVVLARNDFAHNTDFVIFQTQHNRQTLRKHANPLFVGPRYEAPCEDDEPDAEFAAFWPRNAKVEVSAEALMIAIEEVEKLADWVQENEQVLWAWERKPPADT